jgi:YD repeat-containing protein
MGIVHPFLARLTLLGLLPAALGCGPHHVPGIDAGASPDGGADGGVPRASCSGEGIVGPKIQLVDSWLPDPLAWGGAPDEMDSLFDAQGRALAFDLRAPSHGIGDNDITGVSLNYDASGALFSAGLHTALATSCDKQTVTDHTFLYQWSAGKVAASIEELQTTALTCDASSCGGCALDAQTSAVLNVAWTFDASGRLTALEYQDASKQSVRQIAFSYDAKGNVVCRTATTPAGKFRWAYAYDSVGRRAADYFEQLDPGGGPSPLTLESGYSYAGGYGLRLWTLTQGAEVKTGRDELHFHMATEAAFPTLDIGGGFPAHTVLGDFSDATLLPGPAPFPWY